MRIVDSSFLTPATMPSGETEKLHIYNGLDCCVTLEVLETILPQLDNVTGATYNFSMSLMAPIMQMNMRGVRVDLEARDKFISEAEATLERIDANLHRILREGLDFDINWRSPKQMNQLFYEVLQLPVIRKRNAQGGFSPTTNRDALEKLSAHFIATPIINHILALRDLGKTIGVLRTEIDDDARLRTSYNIGGTDTGRLSSSRSDFGSGTNLQNITQRLRRIFVADPGYKFANIDLSQADARGVGAITWNLFGDDSYLRACESGDLHTTVTRMSQPSLPWPGTPDGDRALADEAAYRHLSRRDLSKKLGHGTNFYGQPPTMAKHAQLPVEMIVAFQQNYFKAFPGIRKWHTHVAQTLMREGQITTLLGRKRYFLDRLTEDSTLRKAIAYEPQSITADTIDEGLLNIWRKYPQVQLLLQVHDSILLQYPEHLEDELLPLLLKEIEIERTLNGGRKFTIPAEAMVGWNWSYAVFWSKEDFAKGLCSISDVGKIKDNADGLIKWKGKTDGRRRQKKIPVVHSGIRGRFGTISEPGDLSEMGGDCGDSGGTGEEGLV